MRSRFVIILIIILVGEGILINGTNIMILQRIQKREMEMKQQKNIQSLILQDLQYFPVALEYRNTVSYEDDYGAYRENGGHEGCDILSHANKPGVIPIMSATDGVITNIGWLYLGGYRIGITSDQGVYYYYAHLDSYANGLSVGKTINAGEFLGFMGNTGEGEEGTEGKFPVHLHFGIYIHDENGNEKSVNPYPYLLKINAE